MSNITERVAKLETKFDFEMKSIHKRLDDIAGLIERRFSSHEEEINGLKKRTENIERSAILIQGKKGWFLLGCLVIIFVSAVMNLLPTEQVEAIGKIISSIK